MAVPQFARPDEDLDAAGWTTTPLFSKLQTFPWDGLQAGGLFIDSPNNPTGLDSQSVKFGLNTVTDPGTNRGHRLRVTWYKNGTATMRGDVELRQGSTLIATLTNIDVTAVNADAPKLMFDSYLLSEAEAANITDYSDLRIWVRPNRTAGATTTDLRIRGVELEVPGDALGRTVPSGVPTDSWLHLTADSLGLADGAAVTAWQDDSGNGNSLLGFGATQDPIYKTSISEFSSLPAVRFDGANDRLAQAFDEVTEDFCFVIHLVPRSFQDSRGVGNRTPCIFSTSQDFAGAASNKTLLAIVDESITVEACATLDIPDWMITQTGAAHVTGGTPVVNGESVIVIRFKTGDDEIWENGTRVALCNASNQSNVALQLGCREDNTRHTQMDVRRLLFYDRNLTDQEITDLTTALLGEGEVSNLAGASGGIGSVSSLLTLELVWSQGIATTTGSLSITQSIAGNSSGASSVSGALSQVYQLSSPSSGVATVTGTLTLLSGSDLAGTSSGIASVTGALTQIHSVAGVSSGVSTTSGDLEIAVQLVGASSGQSTVTGSPTQVLQLSGTIVGVGLITGTISNIPIFSRGRVTLADALVNSVTTTNALVQSVSTSELALASVASGDD